FTSPMATAWPIIPSNGSTRPSLTVASSKESEPSAIVGGVTAVDGQSFDVFVTSCRGGSAAAGLSDVPEPLDLVADGLAPSGKQAMRTISANETARQRTTGS